MLSQNFWGPTDAFTMLNLAGGVRLLDDRVTLSINALNVTDAKVQQHVWGDIIARKVTSRIVYRF